MATEGVKKKKLNIVQKMFVAVILGIFVGIGCIFFRNAIGQDSALWSSIYQFLFVDISSPEGVSGIGLFYIVSQLFMHMLQVSIVPLVLVSLALSISDIAQPEKLGRLAIRTLITFLGFYVVAAAIAGTVSYLVAQSGGFNVILPDDVVTETTSVDAYNPLSVIVSIVPDNMISAMSSNNSVLAVCFLGIVIGICMSRLGEKVEPLKKVFVSIDAIIQMFVNFVLDKLGPVCIFCMITRSLAVYGTDYLRPAAV